MRRPTKRPKRPRPISPTVLLTARIVALETRLAELEGRLAAVEGRDNRLGPLSPYAPDPSRDTQPSPSWPWPVHPDVVPVTPTVPNIPNPYYPQQPGVTWCQAHVDTGPVEPLFPQG